MALAKQKFFFEVSYTLENDSTPVTVAMVVTVDARPQTSSSCLRA